MTNSSFSLTRSGSSALTRQTSSTPARLRMNMDEFRAIVQELKTGWPDAWANLPPGMQLIVRAAEVTQNEEEFAIVLRKYFYLLTDEEQELVIRGAFMDSSELAAPIRGLIRELPEKRQREILNAIHP